MQEWVRKSLITLLSVVLCLYTIVFVNYDVLQPQSSLALFVMLGMVLCFLVTPAFKWIQPPGDESEDAVTLDSKTQFGSLLIWRVDLIFRWLLAFLTVVCFGYIFVQTEPAFTSFWPESDIFTRAVSLGERSGDETSTDFWIGVAGLILVLEATRRTIGWIVPGLSLLFILHAYLAPQMPDWLLPHQGQSPKEIVSATFLQSLGVLGPAAVVMFKYVFLFVVFGAFLEMSGATQFIIDFSQKLFGKSAGGPAKVSVLGSGLMGSLSGSAVANAVTTGSFTIPMMKNAGFTPHAAGGITAAAATGGALVPPVMGAGAYMMLEFVDDVTFLEIVRAALIPAVLYYFSLFMIVHFYAKRNAASGNIEEKRINQVPVFEGFVFFGALSILIGLLIEGFSPYKAVTGSLALILVLAVFRKQLKMSFTPRVLAFIAFIIVVLAHQLTVFIADSPALQGRFIKPFISGSWITSEGQLSSRFAIESVLNSSIFGILGVLAFGIIHPAWRPQVLKALRGAAINGIALIAASACVGIIIGIVQTTPMANDFGAVIKGVVESSLLLALIGIMFCSLILGMGVPSVVCYLLMATLMGTLLGDMGVPPLAAHFFIFYYGMMSMVTPPVALAAYASASIAQAPIMQTAMSAFKFSLVGFTLPFMFIYRPALLMMAPEGESLMWYRVVVAIVASVLGVIALAAAVTGFMRGNLSWHLRVALTVAAILLLAPNVGGFTIGIVVNLVGAAMLIGIAMLKPDADALAGAKRGVKRGVKPL